MDYSDTRRIVIDLLKDEWLNQREKLLELKLKKDEIEFFYHESREMILNFLHDFLKESGFEKPAPIIEKTLFARKFMLLGRIDAIYRNKDPPLIVDFKTCKSKEVLDEYKRQLAIYALLYKEHFQKHPTVGIHFLKFKDGLKKFKVSDQALSDIKDLVREIHQKTQSTNIRDYPCKCGWCKTNYAINDGTK
jgi:hypothetical protein